MYSHQHGSEFGSQLQLMSCPILFHPPAILHCAQSNYTKMPFCFVFFYLWVIWAAVQEGILHHLSSCSLRQHRFNSRCKLCDEPKSTFTEVKRYCKSWQNRFMGLKAECLRALDKTKHLKVSLWALINHAVMEKRCYLQLHDWPSPWTL